MPWLIESRSSVDAPWLPFARRPSRVLAYVTAGWLRLYGYRARVRKECARLEVI